MLWLIIPLLLISGFILLFLGLSALKRLDMVIAKTFAITMFSASLWAFGYAIEVAIPTLQGKILWANIEYIGIAILPVSWFLMVRDYTEQPRWSQKKIFILVFIPALTTLVIWTNPLHHLFRGSPSLETVFPYFSVLNSDYGIYLYLVHGAYCYILYFASLVLLARFALKSASVYRRQRLILLLALLFPFVVDMLYVVGVTPIPKFSFTPLVFSITGLMSWKVFYFRFLDMTPLANDVVIKRMQVGVILLDKREYITDLNPKVEKITGIPSMKSIGLPAREVLPILIPLLDFESDEQMDLSFEQDGEKYYYDTRISSILDGRGHILGRVITLTNISERVKLYEQVKKASMRDALTGALNRRAFSEKGEYEIARSLRYKNHLSVIMMDCDDFKSINDKFGHKYGDIALTTLTALCRQQMRVTDQLARYGGDEFAILLPETTAKSAFSFAQRIHKTIVEHEMTTEEGKSYYLNLSMGVVELSGQKNLEELLHKADQALYEAKRAGKGKIILG